jgi:DNA (cytosine-5)-methyltransferase 1
MRLTTIPVIDIFAGPGGLGEGFSACSTDRIRFDVALSVEKDTSAFGTLMLRTFFRQFRNSEVPEEYYHYLSDKISFEKLLDSFPEQAQNAMNKCLLLEMGPNSARQVFSEIECALNDKDIWVLIGGPPCQAYSVIGRSRRAKVKREEFEQDVRHTLYREYLRILARFTPPVFVMENVAGLLSAKFSGSSIFDRIINDLSAPVAALRDPVEGTPRSRRIPPQYTIHSFVHGIDGTETLRPRDYVIEAERFGIPQKRHRVILLGIRSDLAKPEGIRLHPSAPPNVGEMIADLPKLRSRLSDKSDDDNPSEWVNRIAEGLSGLSGADFDIDIWRQMQISAEVLKNSIDIGGRSFPKNGSAKSLPKSLVNWIYDPRMDFACNHESRRHMAQDLVRYLYVSSYAKIRKLSPKLHHFPPSLLPKHKNVQSAIATVHGDFNDRFRVQIECAPATTVTSHISKDGHYFIHHDPAQCRSWTVREAARIQTFPDNYFFEGMRTDEYCQVGNAVPPYLAFQLAKVVAQILEAQI